VDVVSAEELISPAKPNCRRVAGRTGRADPAKHTPLITRIRPGAVIQIPGQAEEEFVFVAGGLLEVQLNAVTVLADTAIRGKDLTKPKRQRPRNVPKNRWRTTLPASTTRKRRRNWQQRSANWPLSPNCAPSTKQRKQHSKRQPRLPLKSGSAVSGRALCGF
jgi:F0F1-type ATP synthase epsilon subunit